MDLLTSEKILIMKCDAQAEANVKLLAKANWDSEDVMNFDEECLDRSFRIGRVGQKATVGKFFFVLIGYPIGFLVGGSLAWWTISVWWNTIFP